MKSPRSLLSLSLFLSALPLCAADWPQFRGPTTDGVSPEKIAKPWTGGAPKTLWKVPSEGGFSSLVVSGGRAFTLALKDSGGAKQESLVALDANTGKELWFGALNFPKYDGGGDAGADSNKGGDGPRSTPAVDATRVYTLSSQLLLRAFDAGTGRVAWSRDLIKEHGGANIQWQNAASPLLEGGLIYVAGGGPDQSILAVDPKDGAVVWKGFTEKITHATPVAATILGQRQVIFFLQSGLLSVDPKTGKELWRYAFDFKISTAASPVVSGDVVYCSAGYGVGAGAVKITRSGGQFTATELYRVRGNKPLANHWSTPVAKNASLYGLFQFKQYGNGPLKCVDVASGTVKWEQPGFGPGQVILVGDQVLVLSDAGELVLVGADPELYTEIARAQVIGGKCWSSPSISNGRIYLRSTTEAVCLDVSGK
jgi:outer membrane protein assembly factor BamB